MLPTGGTRGTGDAEDRKPDLFKSLEMYGSDMYLWCKDVQRVRVTAKKGTGQGLATGAKGLPWNGEPLEEENVWQAHQHLPRQSGRPFGISGVFKSPLLGCIPTTGSPCN